jgi:Cdc6-like AAA superfamily ATPase
MDLPERLSTRVASRLSALERVMFGPYSFDQVRDILNNRLKELNLNIFNVSMMELLARKASSVAGDLRAALKICQRSIEIFRDENILRNIHEIDSNIITTATNEYKGSPMIKTVSLAPALDKAIILTMCKNYNVNGETETILNVLWDRLQDLFHQSFKDPLIKLIQPPYFIFEEALERIIHQGLVKRAYSRGHSGSKIAKLSLRIEITDVRSALKEDPLFKYGGF